MRRSGTVRVLHVDDDEAFRDLTATFLERKRERFDVTTAADAQEGLRRLGAESVDCIVSDYDMPGLDGIEFLEAVRAEHPDLPFLLFTGKGSEEVASEAISADVTDYLQKRPGSEQYSLLANRIDNVVQQHRTQQRVDRRVRQQRLVSELGRAALSESELESLFDAVVEAVADGLDTEYTDLLEYNPDDGVVEFRAGVGWDDSLVGKTVPASHDPSAHERSGVTETAGDNSPASHGAETGSDDRPERADARPESLAEHTLQLGRPVVVQNRATDDRFHDSELARDHDLASGVSVVVSGDWGSAGTGSDAETESDDSSATDATNREPTDEGDTAPWGVLCTHSTTQQRFTDEDVNFLQSVANVLAAAVVRARRERDLRVLRRALDAAGHVVYVTETDGTITYVNDAFESVTGYSATEAVGRTPRILNSGLHDQSFYENLWETILDGEVWRDRVVNETRDGEYYVVDQTIAPVGEDEIERFVAVNVPVGGEDGDTLQPSDIVPVSRAQ